MKKNNIILIGFMGVGKGTVARAMVKEVQEVGLKSHFRMGGKEEVFGSNEIIKTREELIVSLFSSSKVKTFLRELPADSQNLLVATTRGDIERNIKNEKLQCN